MPDFRHPSTGFGIPDSGASVWNPALRIQRTIATTLWLAGAVGMTSCAFHKPPRAFNPPPVAAKAPEPIPPQPDITAPPLVAFEPALYELPDQTDPSARFPEPPPPPPARQPVATAPKVPPPAPEPPPTPALRLSQVLTPEEKGRNTQELDRYTESVKSQLVKIRGKNLNAEQKDVADRVQSYLVQAEQAREQDLVTAVNLARRADLLAKDLLERLP